MKPSLQPVVTSEGPLEPADLSLLRDLRASLLGATTVISLFIALIALPLAPLISTLFDGSGSDKALASIFCLVFAMTLGFAWKFCVRKIRLFRSAGVVLRNPQHVTKSFSRGELAGIASEDGVLHYLLGDKAIPVWIPIRHAINGNLEFITSAPRLDGLMYQAVVLERLELAGALAPLLLRVDYPGYPPMLVERASTAEECTEAAKWDGIGVLVVAMMVLFALFLFLMFVGFGPVGAVVPLPVGVALYVWMRRTIRRWSQIQPRILTVTGLVVEVLDRPAAGGRSPELQRWYRIGDRLYPSGRIARENDPITCGSVVRMEYMDRSPRGGRILQIEPLADG